MESIWLLLELGIGTRSPGTALVSTRHSRHTHRDPLAPLAFQSPHSANRHNSRSTYSWTHLRHNPLAECADCCAICE